MLDIKLKLKPGHSNERSWMERAPLKTLFWNVTYACNYGCEICFADAGRPHADELTTQEALEAVVKIHDAGVRDIIISGGEPFMREDMLAILARMAEFDIAARIASNGSLLTHELLENLRRDTLTKSFQISLDTLDPHLYSEMHRCPPEALNKALDALACIYELGFHTTVSVRLTPKTLQGIPRLLDRAAEKGWATVTIHCPVHTRRVKDAFPQDEDVLTLLTPVFEHFCGLPDYWLLETYIPWAGYHPVLRKLQKRVKVVHRGCRAGRDRLTINPTGWLSPCVCMDVPQAYVGNIRQDNLTQAFNDASVCDLFRHPGRYGICAECPHLAKCGGGCRAAALALTGRLDGQDKSCIVWKQRALQKTSNPDGF